MQKTGQYNEKDKGDENEGQRYITFKVLVASYKAITDENEN